MKKLRILCFHGYNTTVEIMQYQMKNFISTFSPICDFIFLQAPLDADINPIKFFVDRGIPGPYKIWL